MFVDKQLSCYPCEMIIIFINWLIIFVLFKDI